MGIWRAAVVLAFGLVGWGSFTRFGYTTPPQTAVIFTAIVIAMDVVVAALLIKRSLAMFESVLGTWFPWTLIFAATDPTGTSERRGHAARAI
jgi:hypothetical protein